MHIDRVRSGNIRKGVKVGDEVREGVDNTILL